MKPNIRVGSFRMQTQPAPRSDLLHPLCPDCVGHGYRHYLVMTVGQFDVTRSKCATCLGTGERPKSDDGT